MAILQSSFAFCALAFVVFLCFMTCSGSYDYFKFVQQWQPTVCTQINKNHCKQEFTIHGLWPNNTTYVHVPNNPRSCATPLTMFDANVMRRNSALKQKLKFSWPNVEYPGQDEQFWKDEWDKHGTCSVQTFDQTKYFERANEMWNENNLTDALKRVINQKQLVPLKTVEQLIESKTKKKPIIRCHNGMLLWEVFICYEHDGLALRNCTIPKSSHYRCSPDIQF